MSWKRVLLKTNLNARRNVLRRKAAVNRVTFTRRKTMLFVSWTTKLDWWKQLILRKRGSTYYGLVQVSSVVCVNSFKLRFLGSYLNSLIGDLDNSRFTQSRFRSLTTENTYIFVFLALSRKFEWKNTMGNIYFCLFFFLTFSTKFEWQNTISSCLVFTLSSIFISCEEINRRIIFAVKQWNWLDGISSIYFPCLSIISGAYWNLIPVVEKSRKS